ncbi:MAG TPA: VOC family protein [Methylomirabilota bacterium]|nr:VOC family protein [Methylomirabilota bacterium]
MIQSIAFFVYPISDMKRARDFYERVLGLKVGTGLGDEWIEYDVGGTTFAITTMDTNHKPAAKGAVVAFEVDDLDATVAQLKAAGVRFTLENSESPVCRSAIAVDPDGNELIIHKRKS